MSLIISFVPDHVIDPTLDENPSESVEKSDVSGEGESLVVEVLLAQVGVAEVALDAKVSGLKISNLNTPLIC
jgi:hypothetical protein